MEGSTPIGSVTVNPSTSRFADPSGDRLSCAAAQVAELARNSFAAPAENRERWKTRIAHACEVEAAVIHCSRCDDGFSGYLRDLIDVIIWVDQRHWSDRELTEDTEVDQRFF